MRVDCPHCRAAYGIDEAGVEEALERIQYVLCETNMGATAYRAFSAMRGWGKVN